MSVKPYFNLFDVITVFGADSVSALRNIHDHKEKLDIASNPSTYSLVVSESHALEQLEMDKKFYDPNTNKLEIDDEYFRKNQAEIWAMVKYSLYQSCLARIRLEEAIYTKNAGIRELLKNISETLDGPQIMSLCIHVRALIEHIAKYNHMHMELTRIIDAVGEDDVDSIRVFLAGFQENLYKIVRGHRMEITDVLLNGIRGNSTENKALPPAQIDLKAQNILTAIDKLDKSVDATRKAYDFCCEFAHPNSSTAHCYVEKIDTVGNQPTAKGIPYSKKTYNPSSPVQAAVTYGKALKDLVEIVSELLDLYQEKNNELSGSYLEKLNVLVKKYSRSSIRKQPLLFNKIDPCVCGSEKRISQCCGRMISKLR